MQGTVFDRRSVVIDDGSISGANLSFDEYMARYYDPALAKRVKASPALEKYMQAWYRVDIAVWKDVGDSELNALRDTRSALKKNLSEGDLYAVLDSVPNIYFKVAFRKEIEKRFGPRKQAA